MCMKTYCGVVYIISKYYFVLLRSVNRKSPPPFSFGRPYFCCRELRELAAKLKYLWGQLKCNWDRNRVS